MGLKQLWAIQGFGCNEGGHWFLGCLATELSGSKWYLTSLNRRQLGSFLLSAVGFKASAREAGVT